ncbi:MAG TPA: LptF/LptG family permease, partial [Ferruginibacter sp.]|nr:LptF/LptG family permease [Ferruginibacter sp.]
MIKKLDILILKSFLGPFIVTFFIALFVLMMQILWKYIDDLVGKGLDFITIIQFIWYASASLFALALPIAILISSIMTFGNLGESFELVAIKSSGISLLRFMRPLMFLAVIFSVISFFFANNVIPYANLKFVTLY